MNGADAPDIDMVDAPNDRLVSHEDQNEDTEGGKTGLEGDQSTDKVRYLYETDSEGWVSDPDNKADGLSAKESPAGEKSLKLLRQSLLQQNPPVLKDAYIHIQRTSFINTYNELQGMRDQLTSQFEGIQHADQTLAVVQCFTRPSGEHLEGLQRVAWPDQSKNAHNSKRP